MTKWFILSCIFALPSCETMIQQVHFYNEIIVRNRTLDPIQNVEIRVDKTGKVFRCSNIAPRASCSNSFHKRKYQRNPIKITWVYHDQRRAKKEFVLDVLESMNPSLPLRGVLEIKPDGSIAVYFEQN